MNILCELCGDPATDHVSAYGPGTDDGRFLCADHRDAQLRMLAVPGWQAIVIPVYSRTASLACAAVLAALVAALLITNRSRDER